MSNEIKIDKNSLVAAELNIRQIKNQLMNRNSESSIKFSKGDMINELINLEKDKEQLEQKFILLCDATERALKTTRLNFEITDNNCGEYLKNDWGITYEKK